MTSPPLRIGILGAANIARAFASGVAPSERVTIAAVASRDAAKAAQFAGEFAIPKSLGSYEALLADPSIDAVYIPLPNSLHAEWAIKAAEAGKHILCEKPIAVTADEAFAMFAAARRHGVVLREGYPYLAQEQTAQLRAWLAEGAIGRVRLIRSTFGLTFADAGNIRLSPTLGGGTLLDAGSYAVSLVRIVAGERPARVHAAAQFAANGVDLTTVATVEFPSGILAQVSCSFATGYHRHALIGGDDGMIETNFLNHPPLGGPAVLQLKRGIGLTTPYAPAEVAAGNGFLREAESFERLLRQGPEHWTGATAEESVDIMLTLDAIRASARCGTWVELAVEAAAAG